MLRLGAVGGSDENWEVARRLRGAALDRAAPPASCDAVVLLSAEDGAVERLLAAGKHVLLADESVLTDERLTAWSTLARPGGPRLAVLDRDRYLPSRQLIRQQRTNLGEPGLVRLHRWAGTLSPVHLLRDLDIVLWLLGGAPQVVHALGRPGAILQAHLGFPGGGMALIAHAGGPPFAEGYSSLSVIGSTGAAHADDHGNRQLLFTGAAPRALRTSEDARALTAMVQHFVDAVQTGADLSAELTAWRQVLAVREAIVASLAAGRAIQREGR